MVASRRTVTDREVPPPALVAVHVKRNAAPSLETDAASHPAVEARVLSASATFHDTATSLIYQPFSPIVPPTTGVTTGGVASVTVTVNRATAAFCAASVAWHDTVVDPYANVDPDAGVHSTGTNSSTASVAFADHVARAPDGDRPTSAMSASGAMDGAVMSRTLTVIVLADALPASSVAVQDTIVSPNAKPAPDTGPHTTFTVASTTSMTPGVAYVTAAPAALVASTLTSGNAPRTGAVLSATVTVILVVDALPASSVAVQETWVPTEREDRSGDTGLHDDAYVTRRPHR